MSTNQGDRTSSSADTSRESTPTASRKLSADIDGSAAKAKTKRLDKRTSTDSNTSKRLSVSNYDSDDDGNENTDEDPNR